MRNTRRNTQQHDNYAMRRAGLALDRLVTAKTEDEQIRSRRWILAWSGIVSVEPLFAHLAWKLRS
jgi:hypothetical protein